ncbi:MAG: aspartate--tRNA ligase [Sphingopyxis sp.]|nr:aspartate--tRNA ligase [Sphingopyxis sp.]
MHSYRTHHCGALRAHDVGASVRLSGWVHRKRDHGGLLFVDLRDHYGLTQLVVNSGSAAFDALDGVRVESVVTVDGEVIARSDTTVNAALPTGAIEVRASAVTVQSAAAELPLPVAGEQDYPEEIRLRYRFLDLRRETLHANIVKRTQIIRETRRRMEDIGFTEYSTPILTASSPEGARDFLVPSRIHQGKFFALPQAPQQYKQLLMVAGFDRYFQIAPCFRDEDPRADRLPGEFYQLDLEMSFVTQEEVWETMEPVMAGVFEAFAEGRKVTPAGEFPRIPYSQAMLDYGTDKPDLRNPLIIQDVSDHFRTSGFGLFERIVGDGGVVRAIPAPGTAEKSRKFFDEMNDWARSEGHAGLGYVTRKGGEFGGPIAKNHGEEGMQALYAALGLGPDDGCFFAAGKADLAAKLAGAARTRVGEQLDLVEKDAFRFCWIIDFPFYEWDEDEKKVDFAHNPFSMPQGGLEALQTQDPLTIKAYQYDMVCNGYELASGSIRNQHPDLMVKAFELTGLTQADVEDRFGGMYRAFQYGAPPHGGMAAGVDRMVMLLCGVQNLREITLFPMNQRAEDLLMGAPSPAMAKQLKELGISVADQAKL